MPVATFDTHAAVKALTKAGVDPAHAEAITDTMRDAVTEGVATKADLKDLATKEDLKDLATRAELGAMKWLLGFLAALTLAIAARLFGAV